MILALSPIPTTTTATIAKAVASSGTDTATRLIVLIVITATKHWPNIQSAWMTIAFETSEGDVFKFRGRVRLFPVERPAQA